MTEPVAPPVDLTELRRLAEAATPGSWITGTRNEHGVVRNPEHGLVASSPWTSTDRADHDAAYIAAAKTVNGLRLLDPETWARALEAVERDGLIVVLGQDDPEQRTDFINAPREAAAAILAAIQAERPTP
jgi:hypothetical protein